MKKAVALAVLLAGCTRVDSTEHCIETLYGDVINEHMETGLAATVFTDATCFRLTDQNYPSEGGVAVQAITMQPNPVRIAGELAVVYAHDPTTISQVFREKRSPQAVEVELINAVQEGYKNALAGWTIADVFSAQSATLSDSIKAHIQAKIGNRATIKNVFVRATNLPPEIEAARTAAAQQAQALDKQRQQYAIDSLSAQSKVVAATAEARAQELLAAAYAEEPAVLQLKVAEQMSRICANAQQCILGVGVMERLMGPGIR